MYVVNTGGVFLNDQIVESAITYTTQSGNNHEYVKIRAHNYTNKVREIRKGDVIATVEHLTDNKYKFSNSTTTCTEDTMSHIKSSNLQKARLACITYIQSKNKSAQGELNGIEGGPSMATEREGGNGFKPSIQIIEATQLCNSQKKDTCPNSRLDMSKKLTQVGTLDQSKAKKRSTHSTCGS